MRNDGPFIIAVRDDIDVLLASEDVVDMEIILGADPQKKVVQKKVIVIEVDPVDFGVEHPGDVLPPNIPLNGAIKEKQEKEGGSQNDGDDEDGKADGIIH
jgi:hypothetical protein